MDLLTRKVIRSGKKIDLQPLDFSLLEYLMRNEGRVVSKTMIMEHVWNYDFDPQTNVVEARISRLRDKIDRGFPTKIIHTIRGVYPHTVYHALPEKCQSRVANRSHVQQRRRHAHLAGPLRGRDT